MQKVNPTKTKTVVIEQDKPDLQSDLRGIQRNSEDDFFGREQHSHHNGSDETTSTTTTTTTTTSSTTTADNVDTPVETIELSPIMNRPTPQVDPSVLDVYRQHRINFTTARPLRRSNISQNQQPPAPTVQEAPEIFDEAILEDLARIRQNAEQRAQEHQEAFDVFVEIGNNFRDLQLNTRQLINTITLWSWNHPIMAIGTASAVVGVAVMFFRGRNAMAIGNAFLNPTTPSGVIGLWQGIQNQPGTPEHAISRRNFNNFVSVAGQVGGFLFFISLVVKGARHL